MEKLYKNFVLCAFLIVMSLSAHSRGYSYIEKSNPFALLRQDVSITVYPNPAVSKTTIAYDLTSRASVYIRAVDLSGKQLAVLLGKQVQSPGKYEVLFDFEKYNIKPGMYILHILIDNKTYSKKVIVQ